MTTEQILSLARIHSRRPVGDPAVTPDDVHQEICLRLIERPAEHFGHGWVRANSIRRDMRLSAQCRHRRDAVSLGNSQVPDRRSGMDLEFESDDIRMLASGLSKTQSRCIEMLLDGHTPAEIATVLGADRGSVQNSITTAVNKIRERLGLPPLDQVRLGRCRDAAEDVQPEARACVYCGCDMAGRRVDASCCGSKPCRNKDRMKNWHKRQEKLRAARKDA